MKKTVLYLSLFSIFFINAQEAYYDDVDLTLDGIDLKNELATKTINSHTNTLSYTPGIWEASKASDVNPDNSAEVLLIYGYSASGTTARTRGINQNGGGSGEWNREHTYAKSLGTPNLGTSGPGADAHHLRPSDVGFNSNRGSLKFVNGSGNAGSQSGGWYPGDEWKGDVARMMMYMYIRYGDRCKPSNVGIGSSASTPDTMIDLFLEWNAEDPVSDFERQRNTYHENTSNTYAQGNRNPFIDNAYLATRIWGGTPAEDYWGIYTSTDTEAPTVPTNVVLSNITTTGIDVTWTASTDNESTPKYEVYVDGSLNGSTSNTNYSITNLGSGTTYAITVLAKDLANNRSAQTTGVNGTTLVDNTPPTIPTNITISSETGISFKVNWAASTDDSAVTGYAIYIDGALEGTTANTNYNVTGLTADTTYSVRVLAKDAANNESAQSAAVNATTTDGSNNIIELFFSEYVEGTSNNKALEIANLTASDINLSVYSIKKQSNGSGPWINELPLSGTIAANDVFVIIHFQADDNMLTEEADLVAPEGSNFGAPINFNGNDPVGLFKNDVLIDIVGVLDDPVKNFDNMTLRRKLSITEPNTTYTAAEWDEYPIGTYDGIGIYEGVTAGVNNIDFNKISIYPNPANGNNIYIKTAEDASVAIYNVLGKVVKFAKITKNKKDIDVSNLSKGIYIVKITIENKSITKKWIKS